MYGLIIVDVQYDFLPGGALGIESGDQILSPIAQLAHEASLVVASRDWHRDNHFSFSEHPRYEDGSWPAHCVQGTKGAKLYPSVRKAANFVISKGTKYNGPEEYSAFAGKTLRPVQHLQEILERTPIDTVVVCGLALDWCVKCTAFDANALGYRTVVPLDATRAISKEGHLLAVAQLNRAMIETPASYGGE